MCHTERFQQIDGNLPTKSWTFRTVHIESGLRDDVQTLHFDCGPTECAIAVAWQGEKIMSLKFHIASDGSLPEWNEAFARDQILKLYLQTFHGTPDGIPTQLREFFIRVPEFIDLVVQSNGDILSVPAGEISALDERLAGVA